MRTRIKLFYRASWETNLELDKEYVAWFRKMEEDPNFVGFSFVAASQKDNWLIVWYHADKST